MREWGNGEMREWENEKMRELGNEKMRKWENEEMRKWGNEEMGCEVVLEEWGCASEIKQNLNKIKATPCKPAEGLLVCSTLAKVRAVQAVVARRAINLGKVWDEKAIVGTVRRIRKETEKFGRVEEGFLMKKGYKMGGVSL